MTWDRKTAFRVPGHGLLNAGARVFNAEGKRIRAQDDVSCHGKCACGEVSPMVWATKRELWVWHRNHKLEVSGIKPFTAVTSDLRIGSTLEVPGPGTVTWTGDRMVFSPKEDE